MSLVLTHAVFKIEAFSLMVKLALVSVCNLFDLYYISGQLRSSLNCDVSIFESCAVILIMLRSEFVTRKLRILSR